MPTPSRPGDAEEWGRELAMESAPGPRILLDGREVLYFGGTSYHALHGDPRVLDAAERAMRRYGTGTATAGTRPIAPAVPQRELEESAAKFFGVEATLALPSGYLCSFVGLAALADRFQRVFFDESSHYSICDAVRGYERPVHGFPHRDVATLAGLLRSELAPGEKPLLVTDGVFPARGELAPLAALLELAEEYDGGVWVDDAHGAGVLGPEGGGTLSELGLSRRRALVCTSLAKAFGGHGGLLMGDAAFVAAARQRSFVVRGATGISVPNAAAARAGIEILESEPERVALLRARGTQLRSGLRVLGVEMPATPHPIAAFSAGSAERDERIHRELLRQGILVPRARYVGAGAQGVLRVVPCSGHSEAEIERLLEALGEALGRGGKGS